MNHCILMALAATLGTWLITALGAAAVLFFRSNETRVLNPMMGFAAGVMIAASFWSLLQPAILRAEQLGGYLPAWLVAVTGFLGGALFMRACDKVVSMAEQRSARRSDASNDRRRRAMMLLLSITLHNIPEGLAVGVAFGALQKQGAGSEQLMGAISVAVGIGLQNFPEGAAVSIPLHREGYSRRKSFLYGQASAMVEPAAGVLGAMLVVTVETILPYALSFAAGTMILVAVHDLIPECQNSRHTSSYGATMGIILGFAVMMMLDVMLG